jgi:hypothetical protein
MPRFFLRVFVLTFVRVFVLTSGQYLHFYIMLRYIMLRYHYQVNPDHFSGKGHRKSKIYDTYVHVCVFVCVYVYVHTHTHTHTHTHYLRLLLHAEILRIRDELNLLTFLTGRKTKPRENDQCEQSRRWQSALELMLEMRLERRPSQLPPIVHARVYVLCMHACMFHLNTHSFF